MAVKGGLKCVAEIQRVLRGSLWMIRYEGGVEVLGVLWQTFWVIGHPLGGEI